MKNVLKNRELLQLVILIAFLSAMGAKPALAAPKERVSAENIKEFLFLGGQLRLGCYQKQDVPGRFSKGRLRPGVVFRSLNPAVTRKQYIRAIRTERSRMNRTGDVSTTRLNKLKATLAQLSQAVRACPAFARGGKSSKSSRRRSSSSSLVSSSRSSAASSSSARSSSLFSSLSSSSSSTPQEKFLVPGLGFTGPTAQPAPAGSPGDWGYEARAIAHWDVVPYQTFDGDFNVGVLAFHAADIDRVEFSANGGPWLAVSQTSINPQTANHSGLGTPSDGVMEYWAALRASDFNDGPVEIRAIVYPKTGLPKVLQGTSVSNESSSLILNAGGHGTLLRKVAYAHKAGNDANSCLSEAQACRTIARAVSAASTSGLGSSLDGAELRLGEGDWLLPELIGAAGWGPGYATNTRWFTITSAPGARPEMVFITGIDGAFDSAGLNLEHVRLVNLSVVESLYKTAGASVEDYIWFDRALMYFRNPSILYQGACDGGFHGYDGWSGAFYTDITMDNVCNGPRGATLARNVFVDRSGGGHASGSATVVNYSVKTIYGSRYPFPEGTGPDYHGDIYQFYGRTADVILEGVRTISGGFISSRGLAGSMSHDIAISNTNLELPGVGWVFSTCSPIDHLVIKNSRLVGPSSPWCGEGGAVLDESRMKNILIDHTVFVNGTPLQLPYPWDLPGIRYKPEF